MDSVLAKFIEIATAPISDEEGVELYKHIGKKFGTPASVINLCYRVFRHFEQQRPQA
jgi:hypothetical protein